MIVYSSQGQEVEDGGCVIINMRDFYIIAYDMHTCTFILYPLGGHSLERKPVPLLDSVEWEYLGHVSDEGCYTQIHIQGGLWPYITHMQALLSHFS